MCSISPFVGGGHQFYYRATGQATHKLKNNHSKEVLTLLLKFQATQETSQSGDLVKGLSIARDFDFDGQQDLITELPVYWGSTDSWRTQTKPCVHQDPGERSSDPHKRLSQTCLCVLGSLWQRHELTVACCRVRGTDYTSLGRPSMAAGISPFGEGHHYHHCPYQSLASGQSTGREHSPTHQQKIGLKTQ